MGRPKGSTNVPWDEVVAYLRQHRNLWVVPPAMVAVPERTIEVIRRQQRPALKLTDGIIRVRVKAHVTIEDRTLCTLAMKFVPKEVPSGT